MTNKCKPTLRLARAAIVCRSAAAAWAARVEATMDTTCRLCGQSAKLIDSHLLPKALYKLIREPSLKNPNPFLVTRGKAVQTSTQLKRYLLCSVCEDRFNKNGESWVLKHCFRGGPMNRFRLRDLLIGVTPISTNSAGDVLSTVAAPEIQRNKIEYFAASVFWRGAISDWPWQGQTVPPMPLEVPLRLAFEDYLLGKTTFPRTCSLLVYLAGDTAPPLAMHPPQSGNSVGIVECRFAIPGLRFTLLPTVPANALSLSSEPHHPVFISKDQSRLLAQQTLELRYSILDAN
jgi:hypothetical protein